ncbi:MAG: MFS transporter [Deltaproteobacteria bacterium]|nr:MFS transporter [Deltaproteobacteria bacterium]
MTDSAAGSSGVEAGAAGGVDPRLRTWQVRIFFSIWTAYAAYYLCRVNFAVAQPEIERELGWSSSMIGWIPSIYAAFYALGQFINGQLGERLGARRMMTAALFIAACSNLALSAVSSFPAMLAIWAVNGYAQSAGWSLVVKTISEWTTSRRRGMVIGLISTCYQVGNVASWLLAGWLCSSGWGWRSAFWVPGLALLPIAAAFVVFVRNRPGDAGLPAVRDDVTPESAAGVPRLPGGERMGAWEVLRTTLDNRVLWVLGLGYFCMNSVRYFFLNWAVQYMAQVHGRTIKGSAFTAVALPLIGAVGAVSSGWASDTLFGRRRAPLCAIMLFLLAGVCVAFVHVPAGDWVLATAMLGVAGFLIYGPDMLMSGAATIDVSHPQTAAAATGFTMAMGATGAILSGAGVGWLKDWAAGDWTAIFYAVAGLSAVSAMLMVSIWNARPKGAR